MRRRESAIRKLKYRVVRLPADSLAIMFGLQVPSNDACASFLTFQPTTPSDRFPRARLTTFSSTWRKCSDEELLKLYELATPVDLGRQIATSDGDAHVLKEEMMSTRQLLGRAIGENERLRGELQTLIADLGVMNQENQQLTARLMQRRRIAARRGGGESIAMRQCGAVGRSLEFEHCSASMRS